MVLVVLLAVAIAAVLGAATVLAAWPVLVVGAAVLYCLDRPARRAARPVVAGLAVVVAVGYALGPWTLTRGSVAAALWFAVPLAAAALVVVAAGGRARIRSRHAHAEALRRQARIAAMHERRQARRAGIRQRTGVDVDVLADRGGRWVRAAGERVTRRLERRRPQQPTTDGTEPWLDLDHDVAADLSRRQGAEILRLADELDRSRPQPR